MSAAARTTAPPSWRRSAGSGPPCRSCSCGTTPHHPKRVLAAAATANLRIAFLPFRAPELMPCEDLWRLAKGLVAANRAYLAVQEQAERAVAWFDALSPYERLIKTGLFGRKFQWLST